ncbi:MAG: putative toxin-antitoxin system toxin component, PIN family [Steroidobacteraceae bacterium]
MRIVADTNTVLSGLLWQGSGPPRQIINRARAGAITLHTSLVLLAELAEVIARSKFTRRIQNANLSAASLVADYQRLAVLVDPQPLPAPVSRDPDDDQVLACALAAGAARIVSGDRDLLDLGTFRNIPILAAREALDLIRTAAR